MSTGIPWLSISIWFPILAGFGILLLGAREASAQGRALVRKTALSASVLGFLVTLPLVGSFELAHKGFQFVEKAAWIERFNVQYFLGIDGISLWFVPLTALITIFVVVAGWEVIEDRIAQYMGAFLILSGLLIGVFAALDGILFYIFFEATLIPMYLIIGIWGGQRRVYAAFKFFLYTLLGSLLTLVAIIYLFSQSGSFEIPSWHRMPLDLDTQILIFTAFLIAFAVKVPMWPVHT
ncbi:MAG: NADH-quinone oxidoreductase subunit M, partial [Burkholderiaceae bacterium]|nr:NADH-quinone oxidoreductase subunit M [Burkholderiaceae bacterium]